MGKGDVANTSTQALPLQQSYICERNAYLFNARTPIFNNTTQHFLHPTPPLDLINV